MKRLIVIFFLLVVLMSCSANGGEVQVAPLDRLPNNQAGEVVKKAIDYVGGWALWESKKDFSFYKKITQVDSLGRIKRIVKQLHNYNLGPQFQARMTWDMDSSSYLIINNGNQAIKYQNGVELKDNKSKNEAWNSSFGSHYVASMPFKLADPGVILTYDGINSTTFAKPAHAIKVEYEKGAGSTGGMHLWWYYFDTETYDLVGNYLDYGKGHSFTVYKSSEVVGGIKIHNRRFSHASNDKKEILHLKTIYENEEMKFDNEFDTKIFELK